MSYVFWVETEYTIMTQQWSMPVHQVIIRDKRDMTHSID